MLPFCSKFCCGVVGSMSRGKLIFQQSSQQFLVLFISYLNFLNLLLNAFHLKCNSCPIPLTVNCLFIVRFLRHVPVIYVDYPGPTSLTQIYGTFNRAMLRIVPPLRSYAQPLTDAMVEFYSMSQVTMSLWSDFFYTVTSAILMYRKQWNGGHFVVPSQYCGWIVFF